MPGIIISDIIIAIGNLRSKLFGVSDGVGCVRGRCGDIVGDVVGGGIFVFFFWVIFGGGDVGGDGGGRFSGGVGDW